MDRPLRESDPYLLRWIWMQVDIQTPITLITQAFMARLNWLPKYEAIDKQTLQEYFVDSEKKIQMTGKIIKRCKECNRWVSKHDFDDYCSIGLHEFSTEIVLPDKHES